MFEYFSSFAATAIQSDFFAGGLALGLIGVAFGVLRAGGSRAHGLVARRLSVTVTIDNRVAEFRHLLNWLDHTGAFGRVRRFRLTWTGGRANRRAVFADAPVEPHQLTVEDDAKGVSFSGLLNAIDGVAAQEGRALFMTTNHAEKLDPALTRPGRADVHAELGPVGAAAARALFLRFFPGEAALADRFETRLGLRRHAPAALQGWLLSQAADAGKAAEATGLGPALDLAAE